MSRRRALVAVVVLAIVVVAALVWRGRDDGPDGRAGSVVVEPDPDFVVGTLDEPYRIVYRLGDLGDDDVEPSTDEVWVRRPFDSRLETSADGELQSVQVSTMDRLRLGEIDEPLVIARVPGPAVSDVRVAPLLEADVPSDLLQRREQREVVGRRCQVLRSGTLLGAGPLVPITAAEHADSCIDADGLLLEEVLYRDGEPTLHRIAQEVEIEPRLDDDVFETGDITLPADEGGGASLPVDPAHGALGPFWTLPDDERPAGFDLLGRFSIIPPQADRFARPDDPGIVAGTADVFTRGVDFVVIYQGGTVGRVDAFPPTPGAPTVDGGALGRGEQLLGALGIELRFPRPSGRFVHVIGTLAPDELRDLARSLTETEGTGLVYLDD